jgi:Fe2+ or Zn2+ uptake regulation protein
MVNSGKTMAIQNRSIREVTRKLETFDKLVRDPAILALFPKLASIFVQEGAATAPREQLKLAVSKRLGRKPSALVTHCFDTVVNSMERLSAKQVTTKLISEGVKIKAQDPEIAVSKVLRKLAKQGRIHSQRSGKGKRSAFLYQSNALAQTFPVQEERTVTM